MDRLTELFASKPTSFLGLGVVYNGDTRGNGVTSTEQDVVVIPRFNQSDGGGSESHPFKCPNRTDGSVASVIGTGTVNGVTATNLSLTISNSGTKQVYLKVVKSGGGTLIRTSTGGYVIGIEPIAVSVETGSSVPSDTDSASYRLIATYVSGVRTTQVIISSMEVLARDDGTGTSTPVYLWGQS